VADQVLIEMVSLSSTSRLRELQLVQQEHQHDADHSAASVELNATPDLR
jgi:hypothetical protein